MLEKPDLPDQQLAVCLDEHYGLVAAQVEFSPLGADPNTAIYRAVAGDASVYFVKLRSGAFGETAVVFPKYAYEQGVAPIIPPLASKNGQLWANLGGFTVIVYPFIEGRDGYQQRLSEQHWRDLGAALKRIHTLGLPPMLIGRIGQETYDDQARETVVRFVAQLEGSVYDDPLAQQLAVFLAAKRDRLLDLVGRAERLAAALAASPPAYVVCHGDIHAGNILIDNADRLYLVDWDTLILAPKERDLMFFGGGQGFIGYSAEEEQALFYAGYGQTQIDPAALAYYRYERIIQDIAIYCEQIFSTTEGGEDREQGLRYLIANFRPGGTIEVAYSSDRAAG